LLLQIGRFLKDASYQVSIHLAKRFQRRFLEIDQPETITAYGYSVSEVKIFLNSSQSETRIGLGGHICWWNGTKWRNFIEDLT
jgi:hypothetical protein